MLFAAFMVAAIAAAMRARRRRGLEAFVAGAALLPLVVWLIYGSIDWFWEIPALSGPALGFLGMAGALGSARARGDADAPARAARTAATRGRAVRAAGRGRRPRAARGACTRWFRPTCRCERCRSPAICARATRPGRSNDLKTAADLNPLNADPGRIGGTIALQTGQYATARERFQQSISREPGGWYAWLGSGLAASALGDRAAARHDLEMAAAIDSKDAVIQVALDRVDTAHPLTPADALQMLATSL